MKFLARMDVHFPESMSSEELASYQEREQKYSHGLQSDGRMFAIWRVVGEYANYSVFDVEDNDTLHEVLSGFPMYRYMDIKVTPLAKHPNSLA